MKMTSANSHEVGDHIRKRLTRLWCKICKNITGIGSPKHRCAILVFFACTPNRMAFMASNRCAKNTEKYLHMEIRTEGGNQTTHPLIVINHRQVIVVEVFCKNAPKGFCKVPRFAGTLSNLD